MRNPFTYTFLVGLMVFGQTPLAFAGGLNSRNCCPTKRVVVPQVRVVTPPAPQPQRQPQQDQGQYKQGYDAGYRKGLEEQTQAMPVQECCDSNASAIARVKLQILNAKETLDNGREIGHLAGMGNAVNPPASQPQSQPQSFFNSSQTAAYPQSSTQFATFQEVFQPRYHEIIDRSVRASENASTLNMQVLREAVSGALEISKIEQSIAQAEVEVKKINAQAHLLAASRDRQSISTFGTAPLASVQQGDLMASAGVHQAQPVASPNYGVGVLRDGNQCAVCHSRGGGGANAAALQSFNVEALTLESAQRAIESMYDGSMPKGQARYSLDEIRKTKSQLEAALGVELR